MEAYKAVPWDRVLCGAPPKCCFIECDETASWQVLRLSTSPSGIPIHAWCDEHLPDTFSCHFDGEEQRVTGADEARRQSRPDDVT